ncbi:MAG: lipid IV(A) 3-deoxy-D-manno-octulosonic acid transferase [Rhizobiaceae bacterium]|nr:lipid IV(A) 3-deoxy-D-manno-octulosonic acid transferase [Rhizobiaceae bacterium]MCV0406169.1 lipid IV(A) 3-deoxy-D-manno-octulosonic acid transferase [Rhizobiaceae bacterium]
MSERWARAVLGAYRWTGACAYPFVGGYVTWRASRGKEERGRRRERYGFAGVARPDGPLVWVHAASVGETKAVGPLVEQIAGQGVTVVMTTGTVTSASIVRDRLTDVAIHQYVPLDLKPAVSRFLDHWQPDLAIFAESELWPMTILELGARRVPQVLVNARLSDRSFSSWRKRSWLAEALFENLALVVAQSEEDAERFRALGARPVSVSGNLKGDVEAPAVDEAELARLRTGIGDRKRWAAISTHDGEEEIVAEVHGLIGGRHRGLLTILVPRHPDRADAICEMLQSKGLKVARRSRGDAITPDTAVYLGDTIGEMGLYLRLTEIAFVGKSLAGEGGQNPIEPAMLGTAVLSGKHVQNFREAYRDLVSKGAARFVTDRDMLAGAVNFLLNNADRRHAMIMAGSEVVADMRGALKATLRSLEPWLHPLVVKARLDAAANGR